MIDLFVDHEHSDTEIKTILIRQILWSSNVMFTEIVTNLQEVVGQSSATETEGTSKQSCSVSKRYPPDEEVH
jgi:hypothetical protein